MFIIQHQRKGEACDIFPPLPSVLFAAFQSSVSTLLYNYFSCLYKIRQRSARNKKGQQGNKLGAWCRVWMSLISPIKTVQCTEHKSDFPEGLSVASQWKTWYPLTGQIHANPLRLIWVRFLPVSLHCYGCQVKLGRAACLAINTFQDDSCTWHSFTYEHVETWAKPPKGYLTKSFILKGWLINTAWPWFINSMVALALEQQQRPINLLTLNS